MPGIVIFKAEILQRCLVHVEHDRERLSPAGFEARRVKSRTLGQHDGDAGTGAGAAQDIIAKGAIGLEARRRTLA